MADPISIADMIDSMLRSGQSIDPARRRRFRIVAVVTPAVLALFIAIAMSQLDTYMFEKRTGISAEAVIVLEIVLFSISVGAILLWYLQTGFKKDEEQVEVEQAVLRESEALRMLLAHEQSSSAERDRVITSAMNKISELEGSVRSQAIALNSLVRSPDYDDNIISQAQKLASEMAQSARSQMPELLVDELKNEIEVRHIVRAKTLAIDDTFSRAHSRLQREVSSLMRRGNINLILGGLTTVAGISLLTYFTFNRITAPKDSISLATEFLPKITLVIFIQAFAYFFLSLYKNSLNELQYYQNETTNIECRYIALKTVLDAPTSEAFKNVVGLYASTERNPVKPEKLCLPKTRAL